jgi:hypothetical protein
MRKYLNSQLQLRLNLMRCHNLRDELHELNMGKQALALNVTFFNRTHSLSLNGASEQLQNLYWNAVKGSFGGRHTNRVFMNVRFIAEVPRLRGRKYLFLTST